jgi:hypothetical protein
VLSDRGGRDRSRRRNLHCKQLVGAGPGPQEARSGKLTAVETGREPRRRGTSTGRVRKPLRAGGHHACHQQQPFRESGARRSRALLCERGACPEDILTGDTQKQMNQIRVRRNADAETAPMIIIADTLVNPSNVLNGGC